MGIRILVIILIILKIYSIRWELIFFISYPELDFYDPLFLESNQAQKIKSISKIFRSDTNLAYLDQLMRTFITIVGADSVKLRAILTYLFIFARDETTLIYDEILMREIELENSLLSETVLADKNVPSNWVSFILPALSKSVHLQ